jgi:glycyl-tRNA synthetase
MHDELRRAGVPSFYDDSGSIGKRYRRQDETGTPFCITVDGQTSVDQTVTVRDRDSLRQERVAAAQIVSLIRARLGAGE